MKSAKQLETLQVSSKNLDHLGIVAAVYRDLGLLEEINTRIPNKDPRRIVSTGHAVLAMVLNGLGFTNRRLYLAPQFFATKPVERLFGPSITAENLDDHALGEALDEIAEYGPSRFFGEIALSIGIKHNLLGRTGHLDSTSISVSGEYDRKEDPVAADFDEQPVRIEYGYSKDNRRDLKQVMMNLCTSGSHDYPFFCSPQDGNSSDKKTFTETIKRVTEFKKQLKGCPDFNWVADSALYTAENLRNLRDVRWISRVPENIQACKKLVQTPDEKITWKTGAIANTYKLASFFQTYADIQQRWILVFSKQAYERESKTFFTNLRKKEEALKKVLWHLGNQIFQCKEDLEKEMRSIQKKNNYFTISYEIKHRQKHKQKGRPKSSAELIDVGYQVESVIEENKISTAKTLQTKGRFVLATNQLDASILTDEQILLDYKEQQSVERGFRFLKDPTFMVHSVFLKSTRRISALMVVMALCLLVYNVTQKKIREALAEQHTTIPNQLNKQISNPTARWIFQMMEGICIVEFHSEQGTFLHSTVTNMSDVRKKIIRLCGETAGSIYEIS